MKYFGNCVFCLLLAAGLWAGSAYSATPANTFGVVSDISGPPVDVLAGGAAGNLPAENGWVGMPAGARAAYMGIHGGTMPVSLLVAGDGASLVSFVGRTGNDFLEILRRTDLRVPSLLNATVARSQPAGAESTATSSLTAGSGLGGMPVISQGGNGAGRIIDPGSLQPFGLSDKPLYIEGQASKPLQLSPTKRYRLFFRPQYLQPRRSAD